MDTPYKSVLCAITMLCNEYPVLCCLLQKMYGVLNRPVTNVDTIGWVGRLGWIGDVLDGGDIFFWRLNEVN